MSLSRIIQTCSTTWHPAIQFTAGSGIAEYSLDRITVVFLLVRWNIFFRLKIAANILSLILTKEHSLRVLNIREMKWQGGKKKVSSFNNQVTQSKRFKEFSLGHKTQFYLVTHLSHVVFRTFVRSATEYQVTCSCAWGVIIYFPDWLQSNTTIVSIKLLC